MRDLCSILLQLRRTPAAMKAYACPLTRIYAVPQWDAICLLENFLFSDSDFTESAPSIHKHLDEPREATCGFFSN